MQSPARIEAVLQQLRAAWERYPEMRLGQLICSAAAIASPTNGSDSFFVEDDLLTAGLRALAEAEHPPSSRPPIPKTTGCKPTPHP